MKLEDLYQQYAIQTPQQDSTLLRQLMQARQPFSGAKQPERSTMSIASPYDTRAAEIARTTLPKIANDVAMLGANFAPGSGEYLSAQQSAEDTAKAREAFAQGNYGEAAASGANALVNAVGSLPIAHQAIAAGKGAIGLAKGLLGGEHMLMAGAPFFSKLENVVASKMGGKSNIDDLIRMAKNNGVSDAEINATLGGMKGVISKPEAMGLIKERTPELKDVVLGGGKYRGKDSDVVNQISNEYFGKDFLNLTDDQQVFVNKRYNDYKKSDSTHFSQYTEPGAVEGSYREMFVTTPAKRETVVADNDSTSQRMFGKPYGELDANDQKIIDNYIVDLGKEIEWDRKDRKSEE